MIEDCYNAAPESMAAALRVMRLISASRRIAVLGDMKELGDNTEALHRSVGAETVRQGVDRLVAVGELGRFIALGAMDAGLPAEAIQYVAGPEDYPAAAEKLALELTKGDCVLFKASRAMALEKVASAVAEALQA